MADAVDKVLECLGATVGVDFLPHRRWYTTCTSPPAVAPHLVTNVCAYGVYSLQDSIRNEAHCRDEEGPTGVVGLYQAHCRGALQVGGQGERKALCATANQLERHHTHSQDPPLATCTAP